MKLITLGQINKNIFYPILGGLFLFLFTFLFSIDNLTMIVAHPLILSIASSLGMILSFILLILYKSKDNDKIKTINRNSIEKYELEYTNQYEDIIYDKFKFIILSAILDFIQTILMIKFCRSIGLNMWIFDILFIYLFSFLISKLKIYSHQYISIIIIFLVGIIIDIILDNYEGFYDKKYRIIIKLICEILISLGIVIDKYAMEKKFCPSYELCFYHGIITFILFFILLLFATYLNFLDSFKNYFEEIKDNKLKESLIFLLVIILQFIINLCIFATIEKTTSFHFLIILILGQLAPYRRITNSKSKIKINIIIIVLLCFILFMTLIFNEIIILNCCGLEKNTRKYISERAEMERFSKINEDENIDEDNNNEDGDIDRNITLSMEENMENENIVN